MKVHGGLGNLPRAFWKGDKFGQKFFSARHAPQNVTAKSPLPLSSGHNLSADLNRFKQSRLGGGKIDSSSFVSRFL
jgi:hypothetical protein